MLHNDCMDWCLRNTIIDMIIITLLISLVIILLVYILKKQDKVENDKNIVTTKKELQIITLKKDDSKN